MLFRISLTRKRVADDVDIRDDLLCFGTYQKRQGRIEATRDSEHEILDPRRPNACSQTIGLDLQYPSAALISYSFSGRNERSCALHQGDPVQLLRTAHRSHDGHDHDS